MEHVYKCRMRQDSLTQFITSLHALARTRGPASNIHRGHDEFKAAKNSSLLFYEKVKQCKLALWYPNSVAQC